MTRSTPPAFLSHPTAAEGALARAELLVEADGASQITWELPEEPGELRVDALATRLMDLYRRGRSSEVFEALAAIAAPALLRRVRCRMRYSGDHLDPNELLQDAMINIYSYPDRFDASRPGAFRAWSSTIVDNSIRRQLRRSRSGPDVALSPTEILAQHPDAPSRQPFLRAMHSEDLRNTLDAYSVFLRVYLVAYQGLTERERFVLQMVEVRGMRYAELARLMGIRAEALKMVVFRARKRIAGRIRQLLPAAEPELALAS